MLAIALEYVLWTGLDALAIVLEAVVGLDALWACFEAVAMALEAVVGLDVLWTGLDALAIVLEAVVSRLETIRKWRMC